MRTTSFTLRLASLIAVGALILGAVFVPAAALATTGDSGSEDHNSCETISDGEHSTDRAVSSSSDEGACEDQGDDDSCQSGDSGSGEQAVSHADGGSDDADADCDDEGDDDSDCSSDDDSATAVTSAEHDGSDDGDDEGDDDACPTPTVAPTATPTDPAPTPTDPAPTPTDAVPTPTDPAPTPTDAVPTPTDVVPTPTSTPSSSVQGATGRPNVTPPPTDGSGLAGGSSTPGGSLALVLLAVCALAGAAVLVAPAKRARR